MYQLRQILIRRAFSTSYQSTSGPQRKRLIDRVNLAKIGVVTLSVVSGISIYATSRQLSHIDSPSYRPPADWTPDVDQDSLLDKIRHQLRYDIVRESTQLAVGCGLLVGGYDRLWRLSDRAAKRFTRGPDTIRGRLLSNSILVGCTLGIAVMSEALTKRAYQNLASVEVQGDMNLLEGAFALIQVVRNVGDPERREEVRNWPTWKTWSIIGVFGTAVLGVPFLAAVGLYERMGPRAIAPLTGVLGLVTGAAFLAPRAEIQSQSPYGPFDHRGWATLDRWAETRHPKCDVTELASRTRIMLESTSQSRIKLLVIPEKFEAMNQVEWQELSHLLSFPMIEDQAGCRFVCLWPWQLENLDLDGDLALIAESLTPRAGSQPYGAFKYGVLPVITAAAVLHLVYARHPTLLLSVFPRLRPASMHHLPLVVSLAMSMTLLTALQPLDRLRTNANKDVAIAQDRRLAAMGPEVVRGWQSMLVRRQQAGKKIKELDLVYRDIGTTDPLYAFIHKDDVTTTERIAALDMVL